MASAPPAVPVTVAIVDMASKRYEVAFEQLQTAYSEVESITVKCATLEEIEAQIIELLRPRLRQWPDVTISHNLTHYYDKTSITLEDITHTLNCIPSLFEGGGVLVYSVEIPGAKPTPIIHISVSDPAKVEEVNQREAAEEEAYYRSQRTQPQAEFYNDDPDDYYYYPTERHYEEKEEDDDYRCYCGSETCSGDCGELRCGCIDVCRCHCRPDKDD